MYINVCYSLVCFFQVRKMLSHMYMFEKSQCHITISFKWADCSYSVIIQEAQLSLRDRAMRRVS